MDIEKPIKFIIDSLSEYVNALIKTLARSGLLFPPKGGKLSRKLISFTTLSIIIGLLIQSMIPHRQPQDYVLFPTTIIIITLIWLIYAGILHLICKILGANGSSVRTI